MKKVLFYSILSMVLTGVYSCQIIEDTLPEMDNQSGSFSANIDGQNINFESATGMITQVLTIQNFLLFATKSNSFNTDVESFTINFSLPLEEILTQNEYVMNDKKCQATQEICGSMSYTEIENLQTTNPFSSSTENGDALVTFSELIYESGGRAVGTFSGQLYDIEGNSISITEGKFDVVLQ